MSDLYFNPISVETTLSKLNQEHSSKYVKTKDVLEALQYDLLVKNPHNLIVGNVKNVVLNSCASKIEKLAASIIVVIAYVYTTTVYGFLTYSFGVSIQTIAVFSNSEKIAYLAFIVKEIGNKMLMLSTEPIKMLVYNGPKDLAGKIHLLFNYIVHKVCRVKALIFSKTLVPFFKIVKKVIFWNYLQLVLAVRMVFDKVFEVYNWIFQNIAMPFWEKQVSQRSSSLKNTIATYFI